MQNACVFIDTACLLFASVEMLASFMIGADSCLLFFSLVLVFLASDKICQ